MFSASPSGAAVGSVLIPAGSSSVGFFPGGPKTGSPTITTAAAGLAIKQGVVLAD